MLRLATTLTLVAIVALVTALLAERELAARELAALVRDLGAEDVITFRSKPDEVFLSTWTPAHLEELARLDGVVEVHWASGYSVSQGPNSEWVLPVRTASPGYLSARNMEFIAGRDLVAGDAGTNRIVISQDHAQVVFPGLASEDVVGRSFRILRESHVVTGLAARSVAAYGAALTAAGDARYYDVQDVYLHLGPSADRRGALAAANRFLEAAEGLGALEATWVEEMLRPAAVTERTAFVREVAALFRWLVVATVAVATLNLLTLSVLVGAQNRARWALHRLLGCSRRQLLARLVFAKQAGLWAAVLGGGALGYLGSALARGSLASPAALLMGITIGAGAVLVGHAPAIASVLRLHPYAVLVRGRGVLRAPWVVNISAAGLVVGLAAVVLAGGLFATGRNALRTEIAAIGANLVQLVPDRASLFPVAPLSRANVAALRDEFPSVPAALVERHAGALSAPVALDVSLLVADEAFLGVSGTRLASGSWSEASVVVGADVAARLAASGPVVGQGVVVDSVRTGRLELPVGGVARPPASERLEGLQLPADGVLVPAALFPNTVTGAALYVDSSGSPHAVDEIARFLSERHAGSAPFVPQYAAASLMAYAVMLEGQMGSFMLAAALVLLMSIIGVMTLGLMLAESRTYRYGLERVFGATRSQLYRLELGRTVRQHIVIGLVGGALGTLALAAWTGAAGYAFQLPALWLAGSLALATGAGAVAGARVATRVAALQPIHSVKDGG